MLIEVVTFKLPAGMTKNQVLKNYRDTTKKWSEVSDLIRKSYLYEPAAGLGGGVYHWKSVEAAEHWHGDEWRKFVKNLYGSDPEVRRFEVPIVVDNVLGKVEEAPLDEGASSAARKQAA